MKKELASGNGTASSFSCRSAIGRGRGLMGISGSSSSSSPTMQKIDGKFQSAQTDLFTCSSHVIALQKKKTRSRKLNKTLDSLENCFLKSLYAESRCRLYMVVTKVVSKQLNFILCYRFGSCNQLSLIIMRCYYTYTVTQPRQPHWWRASVVMNMRNMRL